MNLDKIIELIAEQVAREVLEGSEDHPDHEDEEDPAVIQILLQAIRQLNQSGNSWLTDTC
jgi:hypothetical protein